MSRFIKKIDTISKPLFISLEITPRCNNQCWGCGNAGVIKGITNSRKPINLVEWKKIINRIAPHVFRFRITGGEPFLSPYLVPIANLIGEKQTPFTIFTNARCLDKHVLISLKRNKYFKGFLISLHGDIAPVHEAFTGVKGSFSETVKSMRHIIKSGLKFSTNTIINSSNIDRLNKIYTLARKLGAKRATFSRFIGSFRENKFSRKRLFHSLEKLHQFSLPFLDLPLSFNCIPKCLFQESSLSCRSGLTYGVIDPWGNIRPCAHTDIKFGNLLNDSLDVIWKKKEVRKWRQKNLSLCQGCPELEKCRGGCKVIQSNFHHLDTTPNFLVNEHSKIFSSASSTSCLMKIIPQFGIRREPDGSFVLIRDYNVVILSKAAFSILNSLVGKISNIGEIKKRYGSEFIDLSVYLERGKFIKILWIKRCGQLKTMIR